MIEYKNLPGHWRSNLMIYSDATYAVSLGREVGKEMEAAGYVSWVPGVFGGIDWRITEKGKAMRDRCWEVRMLQRLNETNTSLGTTFGELIDGFFDNEKQAARMALQRLYVGNWINWDVREPEEAKRHVWITVHGYERLVRDVPTATIVSTR